MLTGDQDALEHHWGPSIRGGKYRPPTSCTARISIILLEHPEITDGEDNFQGMNAFHEWQNLSKSQQNMTPLGC